MAVVRGHNEGSIYHHKSGLLAVAVTMPDGKRQTRYARTRGEARELLRDLLRRRDERLADPRKMRLGAYLDRWLSDVRPNLAPATWRKHESIVRVHLRPALGHLRLSQLSVGDVRGYLLLDPGRGRSGQTTRHHRATLRRALADALRDGLVTRNVAALAEPPRMTTTERRFLTAAQVRTLIDGTREHRLWALWVLAVTAGLRSAECRGLVWSDIDWDNASLTVAGTLHRSREGDPDYDEDDPWVRRPPKTAKSRRTVPLAPIAIEALRVQQERQAAARGGAIDGYVFRTVNGYPIDGSNVLPELYAELDRLGLPRVTFHDLRHSAATVLFGAGVALPVIADLLGHSTIRVTADLYRHRVPELSREAAERMQEAVG